MVGRNRRREQAAGCVPDAGAVCAGYLRNTLSRGSAASWVKRIWSHSAISLSAVHIQRQHFTVRGTNIESIANLQRVF